MHYILFSFFLFSIACATPTRHPAAVAPPGSLLLEQALQQGPAPTLEYLKTQTSVTGYIQGHPRDPAAMIPKELRAERPVPPPKEKKIQQAFFKRFRPWSLAKKTAKARELTEGFECSRALESQSLGFSLELDFPDDEATIASTALHEKVLSCATFPRHESLFRLAIFAIQKNNCPKALEYLEGFPTTPERGMKDRLAYLRGLCSGSTEVAERNPWGGYGIRLTDPKSSDRGLASWYLSANSGSPEWDRLLKTFMELTERGELNSIRHISSKINYEKFRELPFSFQASMLTLMSFSGADLAVFQALHRYLSDHPDMAAPSVESLLFPKRYWKEIVENSKEANPILVKALIRQESAFDPSAKSRARAAGLMQLIYPTARHFGVKTRQQWLEPGANIRAGSQFLAQLIQEFGSIELALAAYNAGPAMVHQWQKRYPTNNVDLFVEMIPYSETREYVRLVKRNFKIYENLIQSPEMLQASSTAKVDDASVRSPASIQDLVYRRTESRKCDPDLGLTLNRSEELLCSGVW
jgi:hypothetical protein